MNIQTGVYKAAAFPAATEHGAVIIDADGQAYRFCQEQSQWLRAYDGDWVPASAARMDTYRDAYPSWIVVQPSVELAEAFHAVKESLENVVKAAKTISDGIKAHTEVLGIKLAEGINTRFGAGIPVKGLLPPMMPNKSKGMSFAEARKEMRETGAIFTYTGSNMMYATDPCTEELMWTGIDSSKPFEHAVPDMREINNQWRKLRDRSESDTFR